ncbi:hypothetical protein E6O75_ATG09778 [Venturia nashicola]|uniref:Uncharacterized protein n=1 Tax=Venturia nashicola TaxID=86259 RepID=A0A4Z1NZJ2_9PEZI|nr:hypothetical protein E6O75_ATG09778 [Venturia nashicola]
MIFGQSRCSGSRDLLFQVADADSWRRFPKWRVRPAFTPGMHGTYSVVRLDFTGWTPQVGLHRLHFTGWTSKMDFTGPASKAGQVFVAIGSALGVGQTDSDVRRNESWMQSVREQDGLVLEKPDIPMERWIGGDRR